MDLGNKALDLLNCKIRFTVGSEGEYEGLVIHVCPKTRRMIFNKLYLLPQMLYFGNLNFFFHELTSYTVIEQAPSEVHENLNTKEVYSYKPTKETDLCIADDLSEVNEADDLESNFELEDEKFTLQVPCHLKHTLPADSVIVDYVDDIFHAAIKDIKSQESIGISLEGAKVDRYNPPSWICVSTATFIYLFDIDALTEVAFPAELKSVLEDSAILKIFHDCRQASDCLFHQYNIRLVNVFDTQVADVLVNLQKNKECKLRRNTNNLDNCLHYYLEIPESLLFQMNQKLSAQMEERPLRNQLRKYMIKNVMYLRLLRNELTLGMLTPFRRSVDVYLNVLQTQSERELLLSPFKSEELPQQLCLEGLQVVKFRDFVSIPETVSSGPPYREMINPVKKYINFGEKESKVDERHKIKLHRSTSRCSEYSAVSTPIKPITSKKQPRQIESGNINQVFNTHVTKDPSKRVFEEILNETSTSSCSEYSAVSTSIKPIISKKQPKQIESGMINQVFNSHVNKDPSRRVFEDIFNETDTDFENEFSSSASANDGELIDTFSPCSNDYSNSSDCDDALWEELRAENIAYLEEDLDSVPKMYKCVPAGMNGY